MKKLKNVGGLMLSKVLEKFTILVLEENGHWVAIMCVDNESAIIGCGATSKEALQELMDNME